MAAVYTAKGGRSEPDAGTFPPKNTQAGVKRGVAPLLTNAKMIKVEESSEDENTSLAEQIPTRVRSETATMDAIPAIAIKEESIEDDEYVQIKLVDVEESSEERTENNESDRDNESIDGEWLFRCVDCGEAFGQREAYLEHQRQHVHDGPIVCLDSDSQWNDLLVSEDGGRRTLCCAICGRKFSSSRGFFTHQLKHRNEALKQEPGAEVTAPKQRLFKCEDCGKAYSSIGLCLNHQRSHKQASKSVFHQLDHLKKKSFQCPTCGRCYSRASALDAHRRCHEVKLIKVRNSCMEKSVSTQEHVVENGDVTIKEEKKGKPLYECTECGRAFSTTTGLSTHQRFTSHPKCSEAKPKEETKKLFNCNECDKSFLTNTALAIHQRWHIRRARISSSGQSFSCEECGKVFTSLTFYHKHQRLVHSGETPAKSFLHQVCQLKKKAFECKDCGRRFSRATALQSHQLCHTDVFGDAIEKASPKPATTSASSSPPQKLYLCDKVKPESFAIGALVYTQETPQASPVSGDLSCDEADDDMGLDGSEINDFIVEVVSISGSDEEKEENDPEEWSKTDPELEATVKEPLNQVDELSHSLESKAELDKITDCDAKQVDGEAEVDLDVDYEAKQVDKKVDVDLNVDNEGKQVDRLKSPPHKGGFQCPECDRKFSSASAIRCHRLWHKRPMGWAATQKKWNRKSIPSQCLFTCNECGKESTTLSMHRNHMRQHQDPKPYKSLLYQLAGLQKKNFKCEVCGMRFSRASALQSHQQHHDKQDRTHKCPHCDKAYSSQGALYNHRKTWHSNGDNRDSAAAAAAARETKKEVFNPRKTLLGPKVYHCEHCGKGFWSFGAFSQHKQNQRCTEMMKNESSEQLSSVNGHTRGISKRPTCPICGKKFRHRGILACHMRRHRSMPRKNHTCNICGKSYRLLGCFLKHQQVHESESVPPPVKSFQHQVEQVAYYTYSCPDCGKKFNRAMALQFHMRSHGYETGYPFSKSGVKAEAFQCSHCPVHFSSEEELQDHLNKKHGGCQSEISEGRLDGELQKSPGKLSHFLEKGQTSEVERCAEKSSLKSLSETSVKPFDSEKYQCNECGRGFSVVGALNFHKRIHLQGQSATAASRPPGAVVQDAKFKEEGSEGKGLYICPECGRSFGTNSALGTHRRWHTDKKFASTLSTDMPTSRKDKTVDGGPYRCDQCGKGFFYFCVLRRHQMHHPGSEAQAKTASSPPDPLQVSDGKPAAGGLSCPKCGKTFTRSSLLATHYQAHHVNTSDCAMCNLCFSSEGDLLKHCAEVHPGEKCLQPAEEMSTKPAPTKKPKLKHKLHGCPDCNKRFYKIRGLRAHRWQAHRKNQKATGSVTTTIKPFICTGCDKRYSSQGALYNHRKVCTASKIKSQPAKMDVEEEPSLPQRPSEQTYKWLFKCHKCGKAFPSHERLEAHKDIAKSRPHCCALCCRGYWTETQLQQHLVWHDEVRRRLPADLRYRLSTFTSPTKADLNPGDYTNEYHHDPSRPSVKPGPTSASGAQSPADHKCPQCGDSFPSFLTLQQHQTEHVSDVPYCCSLCPRTFSQVRDLIDHHQECMSESKDWIESGRAPLLGGPPRDGDGLTCIECGITFGQELELHQHYIEHARGQYEVI